MSTSKNLTFPIPRASIPLSILSNKNTIPLPSWSTMLELLPKEITSASKKWSGPIKLYLSTYLEFLWNHRNHWKTSAFAGWKGESCYLGLNGWTHDPQKNIKLRTQEKMVQGRNYKRRSCQPGQIILARSGWWKFLAKRVAKVGIRSLKAWHQHLDLNFGK